jgi:AraC-like DNA-binding protein
MPVDAKPSGLLSQPNARPFTIQTLPASGRLALFVDYFWIVQWALPDGETFESENLPHPCVHLVYEPGHSGLFGPIRGHFRKTLSGQSRAIGCRFKPGLFYAWWRESMHTMTDQVFDINRLLPISRDELEGQLNSQTNVDICVAELTHWLTRKMNQVSDPDATAVAMHNIVMTLESNAQLLRVDQVCDHFKITTRQLERGFRQHVGLTPKWVLRMYRLQQLANKIIDEPSVDWADTAAQLGYFDQAHCIKDFKRVTGKTPASYRE